MPTIESEKPRPDGARLAHVLRCADSIEPDTPEAQSWLRTYVHNHSHRIAHDLEMIERYSTKDDVIVEIGSLPLILTASLKDLGYGVLGIDIDPSRFSPVMSNLGLNVLKCDIETEQLPLETESCDLVVFNEIFEHLRINPIFTMTEVHRILKPNGKLLLSTPNLRSLRGLFNFLLRNKSYSCCASIYNEYEKLQRIGHMGHVREYTTREVIEFLSRIGFQIESLVFRGGYNQASAQLAVRLMPSLRPFVTYVALANGHRSPEAS